MTKGRSDVLMSFIGHQGAMCAGPVKYKVPQQCLALNQGSRTLHLERLFPPNEIYQKRAKCVTPRIELEKSDGDPLSESRDALGHEPEDLDTYKRFCKAVSFALVFYVFF